MDYSFWNIGGPTDNAQSPYPDQDALAAPGGGGMYPNINSQPATYPQAPPVADMYGGGYGPPPGGLPAAMFNDYLSPVPQPSQIPSYFGMDPVPSAYTPAQYPPGQPMPSTPSTMGYGYGGAANSTGGYGQPGQGFGGTVVSGDVYSPTVRPFPNFDANLDCERLKKGMAGVGCDRKPIIEIMPNRSVDQRVAIVKQFKTMYGKDLIKEFGSELRSHFLQVIEGLCYSQVGFLARELRRAMEGAGTNERALIEILAPQTNEQIRQIKAAYVELYPGRNLEKDITSETSGHFLRILISLCQANRDESTHVDPQNARRDAEEMYRAGEKKMGTDKSTFNMILASRSHAHLRAVFEEYKKVSKRDIEGALKSELHGDLLQSYLAIVRCIQDKPKYYAHELKKSMEGPGTRDTALIRLVISRSEIDLGEIKKEFQKINGKSLEDWITHETSRDYRKVLLALCSL